MVTSCVVSKILENVCKITRFARYCKHFRKFLKLHTQKPNSILVKKNSQLNLHTIAESIIGIFFVHWYQISRKFQFYINAKIRVFCLVFSGAPCMCYFLLYPSFFRTFLTFKKKSASKYINKGIHPYNCITAALEMNVQSITNYWQGLMWKNPCAFMYECFSLQLMEICDNSLMVSLISKTYLF